MNQNSLIMILIAILIVVFGVVAVVQSRKHGLKTDYRTLFILGVIWMGFGVVELFQGDNYLFFIIGVIFAVVGISKRDQWKKPEELDTKKKNLLLVLVVGLILFTLGTGVYVYLQEKSAELPLATDTEIVAEVTDFDSCAKYYPVMESYPMQCSTPDGDTFTEEIEITPEPGIAPEIDIDDYPEMEEVPVTEE